MQPEESQEAKEQTPEVEIDEMKYQHFISELDLNRERFTEIKNCAINQIKQNYGACLL